MRCKNCGWDNPVGKSRCEKCNVPLSGSMIDSEVSFSQHPPVEETGFRPDKTVYEEEVFREEASAGAGRKCEKCGYPLRPGQSRCPECETETKEVEKEAYCPQCGQALRGATNFCPNCGHSLISRPEKKEFGRKTVLPGRRFRCSLTLIPEEKEHLEPQTLDFSGEEIILNRDNTEPDNNTITSQEQAVLIYENKKWYIQDRSSLKTTYVYAGDKVELHSGDIIVLGDRKFEFHS